MLWYNKCYAAVRAMSRNAHYFNKKGNHMKKVIESNFTNLCIELSKISNSLFETFTDYTVAANPFDPWFSRIYAINEQSSNLNNSINNIRTNIINQRYPNSLMVTELENFQVVKDLLESYKFNCNYIQTGMAIQLNESDFTDRFDPNVKIIETALQLQNWISCVKSIFGNTKNIELYSKLLERKEFTFLGYFLENKIVGTTLLYISDNVAGVHIVGTVPELRNTGIGSRITKSAFGLAKKHGATIGVLQSSPMGKSMYSKLGFKEFSTVTHWNLSD